MTTHMALALVLLTMLCGGCETLKPVPYVFGGVGYAKAVNKAPFEETGVTGTYGIGLEFTQNLSCEYRHRSMVANKPEIVTDDGNCEYTHYFGERK